MVKPQSYCETVWERDDADPHKIYHNTVYGFPLHDDNELFGRLILEINQAGLSWTTILKKQENFRKAFDNFDIQTVAKYGTDNRTRLLENEGIIRNRLKINAAIYNANVIMGIQKEHGSFKNWLDKNHPLLINEWVKLFKKYFKFTGREIIKEFLMSIGYLKGAHIPECPIYQKILTQNPKWFDI
ncbi:MAG: DNA-3-methyladenine glycosylase I [Candidatus Marinimicrobia bacterium]|nr:DNA-3-methyladenine glycosylase I [Candidatus Neomarinimicrobiota bacterium]